MGEKGDAFIFEQFETAARRYPAGSWVPGYETPLRNVKRDISLAELACRSIRSWGWMPSPGRVCREGKGRSTHSSDSLRSLLMCI